MAAGHTKGRLVVLATAITTIPGIGVVGVMGASTAHAQDCDPVEVAKLLADDGAVLDAFGWSVSFSDDTAVIGAWTDDNGSNSGSAYVFTRSGGVWTQQAKLVPGDGEARDYFGTAVAISDDTALIGARGDDDNGSKSGSAYVFTRSGGVWTQQAKLMPGDGAKNDAFGFCVSISGDTAVIGANEDDDNGNASGSAYVFTRSGGVWAEQAKLLPADGAELDLFGWSASISGGTVVIGMIGHDDNPGAAYVFTQNKGVWTQQTKFLPADGAVGDYFGFSVSVHGDTAVIGAKFDDDNGSDSGSAYVFTRSEDIWTQQAKLLPIDGAADDKFGVSVSISGDRVVAGAYLDDDSDTDSGSVYVFTRTGAVWTQRSKLVPVDGAVGDYFGFSVFICDDTVAIGAYRDDDNGGGSGSVYVFDLHCNTCPADLNGDGIVDTRDFIVFLDAWSAGDPLADWDENGVIDTRDFVAFLGDWAAGCP